ncbi:hypothetical protein OU415_06040 [Saccharopolyspora sp. WRP15-2]|uniref:Secreted protein n=1 Tax=Saccharopolyspora oryzae TaxID=2997343 RepID=A0ABT4UTE0_9PSEU|nr:hypothetical protein [Saccharopolyspora oryzae]MDA3624985.1 hypothetical protein [Saccharopolyspora oryzae]
MFWIQLSTFILFNLLILALLLTHIPVPGLRFAAGQHAGTGDGEYTVWHLIADVEAERGIERHRVAEPEIAPQFPVQDPDEQPTGRHHLRPDRAAVL